VRGKAVKKLVHTYSYDFIDDLISGVRAAHELHLDIKVEEIEHYDESMVLCGIGYTMTVYR
jgi:hypothetical protein